ncbi:arylesterase [Paraferrimonas haliotis]|uniref:Arylesterase n=2 Tax=Paraferrimonas haliotis TaxID=2013866 RepID=A0AA37TWQ9_9GAMM|nr:arylesterase [Paraferrimonas haliotis]GLS84220.1 arylesterase [Paraferrimonas haliotis]
MIVGDSLSASYGMPENKGWVYLLEQTMPQHQWINASSSGETTGGGLRRLTGILEHQSPDVIFIELGGNDGLRGFPPKKMKNNLEKMVDLAKSSGAKVLLSEVIIPPNYGPRYSSLFTKVFQEVAEEKEVELVPFFMRQIAIDPSLMQQDGIHPNQKAQPIIADIMRPYFE